MITTIFASRLRMAMGSGVSMVLTELVDAKIITSLTEVKLQSMQAARLITDKFIAKATTIWMLIVSLLVPIQQPVMHPAVESPAGIYHARNVERTIAAATHRQESTRENPLFLHSFEKEYTLVFSGKLSCGGGLCESASLQIGITTNTKDLTKVVTLQPDGAYEVSFLFKGAAQEHVDWWLTADSPDSAAKHFQGREILLDDSQIKIEKPVSLL